MVLAKKTQIPFVVSFFLVLATLSILFADFLSKFGGVLNSCVLAFAFGYILADLWELITCHYLKLDGSQKIGKYHYHHSLFGLSALILSFLVFLSFGVEIAGLIFFWGVGVIIQHTLNDKKFVFITKRE